MRDRERKKWLDFTKTFSLISTIELVTFYLIMGIPLFDVCLLIIILIPVYFTPKKSPLKELPPSRSILHMVIRVFQVTLHGFWWDVLFYLIIVSLIAAFGYREWLTLRSILIIVNIHCWLRYFYQMHWSKKSR